MMAACLLALAAAPAMGQGAFPSKHRQHMPLSPRASEFVVCGLDLRHLHPFETLWRLTGESDWIQDQENRDSWGSSFSGSDAATQPAEPVEGADVAEDPATRRATSIELIREGLTEVLRERVSDARWRRMASILETHLADWQELAVLEIYHRYGRDGSYVILARTPRGCFTATDVAPWHAGLKDGQRPDDRWQAQPRIMSVDDAQAAAFFQSVAATDEPNILLAGRAGYDGSLVIRPRAVLHVMTPGRKGGPWRAAIFDDDAWLMTRAPSAAEPKLDPAALEFLRRSADAPTRRPKWRDVLAPETQRPDYNRVRDHVAARMRQFWMAAMAPQRPDEEQLTDMLDRLAQPPDEFWGLMAVGGAVVGCDGGETDYWRLSQAMLRVLSRQDYLAMLDSDALTVRGMGMMGLALTARADAAPILTDRLGRREAIECLSGGCCVGALTEGRFALELLHNARFLEALGDYAPLLSRPEQFALDLAVLARDDCAASHALAGNALSWGLHEAEWALTWPALRELAPELPDVQLVKALGRIRPEPPVRAFLLATLADTSLDAPVRLAAASGLTRDADPAAMEALVAAEADLNDLADGAGTACVRLARSRAAFGPALERFDHWDSYPSKAKQDEAETLEATLMDLLADCPELAVGGDQLMDWGFDWPVDSVALDSPELARWQAAVLALSGRLGEFEQPWNTYGDLAWRLDFLLQTDWAPQEEPDYESFLGEKLQPDEQAIAYGGRLGRENWDQIRSNVTAYLNQREAPNPDPHK